MPSACSAAAGAGCYRRRPPTSCDGQRAVVDAVRRSGADLHRHYEPGHWVPHLTLAPRLHLSDLPVVAARVYDVLPITATFSPITLIDTSTGTRHPLV